ncbi:molecular chaperone HtpG [Halomicronema sp. CCY15110]|uniref:molecular chaperone HtpG n=1 Tax=Halomicronema sp. CCY15110 TaxID=2767773 RepID=UPI00195207C2|nr:molecular chaperone HtpG [Halomicronema sp. CCY15110]
MATILEKGNISIHTENIFPIIKKWLYSDHEIFLRELISNGVDAIQKLSLLSRSGQYAGEAGEPEISIQVDKDAKTLSISDTGLGMTAEEVKKYINQVAFSSAEEFVSKYKESGDANIIGHFGLGFYSSFMVSSEVEIDTLSYQDGAEAVHWRCDGTTEFELSPSERSTIGTTVTLHLLEDEQEYLEPTRIRQLVKTYCDFLPVPIKLDDEVINKHEAPWKESLNSLSDEEYLEFYRYLYPFQEEPLLWVHLKTDYPFDVNGILYFPKLKPDIDVTKSNIKLFCNQVFVSDNCEEVIPRFLMPLRGVIDSPDIPLNVSRSFLQNDRTVRKISEYIARKVGDSLKGLYRTDLAKYISSWQDLGTFIKFGAMNDDKFKQQVEDFIIFRTTAKLGEDAGEEAAKVEVQTDAGDAWSEVDGDNQVPTDANGCYYTNLKDYLERNQAQHENRVFYATDEASQATYIALHQSQGLEVLFLDTFIDQHFVTYLEQQYSDVKFSRVDAELDDALFDKDQESEIVDPTTNQTRDEEIKSLFETALNLPKLDVRTQALKTETPDTPPAMVLLPEQTRRMQEMMAMMQQTNAEFPEEHVLLVNTAHPLIKNLSKLKQGAIVQPDGSSSPAGGMADLICQHVYDLALMAQKGFDANGMKSFVERSSKLLTQLTDN